MLRWIVDGLLAGSHRPGYAGESGGQVDTAAVDEWLEDIRDLGIRSIICLLHDEQLSYYSTLPSGLLQHYRDQGFNIRHIPARDHSSPPLTETQLDEVWASFTELEKPVVVHCSAGMDRTGAATEHITRRLADSFSA